MIFLFGRGVPNETKGMINLKSSNIPTLHRDVKYRRIAAPRILVLMFLDGDNFINNEDI